MEPLGDWVHKLRIVGIAFVVLIVVVVGYLVYHAGQFESVSSQQALNYGQLARNLAAGNGFSTHVIRPLHLAKNPRFHRHPELMAAPVFPYIASFFMRIMPHDGRALALCSGLGFLLCVPLIFLMGWWLFDAWVGGVAAAIYLLNLTLLQYSISGLEVSWLTLWVTLLFCGCYGLSEVPQWRIPLAVGVGLVCGLIYLTNYLWLIIVPLVAAYILLASRRPGRWTATGAFVAAFVLVIAPWLVRTARVTGNPFYTAYTTSAITQTRTHPGNTLYREFRKDHESWAWYVLHRPREILEKLRDGLDAHYPIAGRMMGWYVMAFFVTAILVSLGSAPFERLRYLWYISFGFLVIASTLTVISPRLVVPLCTLPIVVASAYFLRLVRSRLGDPNAPKYSRNLLWAIAALMVIHAMPVAFHVLRQDRVTPRERLNRQAFGAAEEIGRICDGPVVTDVPWLVAWHADVSTIWLPKTRLDLRTMEETVGKIKWLLLTSRVANKSYDMKERTLKEWGPAWRAGVRGDLEFEGYTVHRRLLQGQWVLFKVASANQ